MSNFLAIATVTATLQRALQSVIGVDVPGAKANTARPDAPGAGLPQIGVNIFLYQITPNAALRNADLPTRNAAGQAGQRPVAALDLHYLLTFYGNDGQLEPQRVLGSIVRSLHAQPLLTRQMIRDTVTDPAYSYLATSNLADAVDPVRFSPLSFSLEELSKLWSVLFQTPYALSTAYRASVVLIEEELSPVVPLPVRQRHVFVVPFQSPFIEKVDPQIVAAGATLTIQGQNLRGEVTNVMVGGSPIAPTTVTNQQITLTLPLTLPPGVLTAQVVQEFDFGKPGQPKPHPGFESNVAPFILQPTINTAPVNAVRGAALTITFFTPIRREQSVALLLNNDTNNYVVPLPTRAPTDPPATTSLDFDIPATLSPGLFFLRVRVDGAESALTVETNKADPKYNQYIGPLVNIT
jgi:hypothetical protein